MNREIRELREVVTKLVPMLAGRGLKVTQIGTQAFVKVNQTTAQPVLVNIPSISDNASPDFILAIQGFIDHEVAHVLITDFAYAAAEERAMPRAERARRHNLHNIVEDTMIEREMIKIFPGSRKTIHNLRTTFLEKVTGPAVAQAANEMERFNYLLVPAMRALAGHPEFQEFMDKNGYWDNPMIKEVVAKLSPATKARLPHLTNTRETFEVAAELDKIMYSAPPPPPPAPPQQEQQKQDEPSDGEFEDKPDQQAGEGDGDGERDHSESEPGEDGEADESGEAEGDDADEEKTDDKKSKKPKKGDKEDDQSEDDETDADEDAEPEGDSDDQGAGDFAEPDDGEEDQDDGAGSGDDAEEDSDAEDDDTGGSDAGNDDDHPGEDGSDEPADGEEPDDDAEEETDDADDASDEADDGAGGGEGDASKDSDADGADEAEGEEGGDGDGQDDAGDQLGEGDVDGDEGDTDGNAADQSGDAEPDHNEADAVAGSLEHAGEPDAENGSGFGASPLTKSVFDFDEDALEGKDMSGALAVIISEEAIDAMKGHDYNVLTREGDRIEILHPPANMNETWVPEIEEKTRSMVGRMQKDIERMMASQSHVVRIPGHRSGRLHAGSLHRMLTGDDRVFSRKQEHKSKDTAVSLVVDNSGSMKWSSSPYRQAQQTETKIYTAMIAAGALSSTLDRVSIANEVIGFTTGDYNHLSREVQAEILAEQHAAHSRGITYHRTSPIMMPIYKGFDERVTPEVRRRIAYMAYERPGMAANIDGESLEYAAMRLLQRREKRKVMIVLSDGQPAGALNVMEHTKLTVEKLTKVGIDMVGIGIMDPSVKHYYPKHVVLNDLEELPAQIMRELRAILA